jgi:xanthine dehydrogenase accessory factor
MATSDLIELSRELTRQHEPHAWITVIGVTSPSSAYVGAQAIVKADGEMRGWIGGGCVQSIARTAALQCMACAAPQRLRLSNTAEPGEAVDVRPMSCASNGEVELFIQPAAIAPRLRIYGRTPIARMAAWLARELDFEPQADEAAADRQTVQALSGEQSGAAPSGLPERETYALIATQGDGDEAALEAALRSDARAVLVIASSRKAERLRTAMGLRGIAPARLAVMHAPAGPDIGAVTPGEIALAAVVGLVALRRGYPQLACPHSSQAGHEAGAPARPRPAPAQPRTGYVNPVCGAVIDPAHAKSSLTMAGQTHYFCCDGCRVEFERDPQKYLQIAAHMRVPAGATHE